MQLEFVRHSLLTRKEIKIGQKIETLEAQYMPRYLLVKKYARIVRVSCTLHSDTYVKTIPTLILTCFMALKQVVVYVAFSVYYWNNVVAIIDPKVIFNRSIIINLFIVGFSIYHEFIQILWPFMAFSSRQTIGISVWVLVAISGLAWRHVFRSITVVLLRGTDFP